MKLRTLHLSMAIVAALAVCSLASAQVRQTALYIDDGNGNFTVINGAHNGGTYVFPTGGGTLVTSSGGTETLGTTGSQNGSISLNSSTAATQTTTIQAGAATDAVTYVLPTTHPTANQVLTATSVTGSGPYFAQLGWGSGSSSAVMIAGSNSSGLTGSGPVYSYPLGTFSGSWGSPSIQQNNVMVVNRAGTIKNLTVTVSPAPGTGASYTFEVYAGTSGTTATGVKVTISGSAVTASDNSHTYTMAAGELLSIKYTGAGGPGMTNAVWAFDIQ